MTRGSNEKILNVDSIFRPRVMVFSLYTCGSWSRRESRSWYCVTIFEDRRLNCEGTMCFLVDDLSVCGRHRFREEAVLALEYFPHYRGKRRSC